jgi:putative ABC transport system permease protein
MITKIAWKNIWFKPLNTALSIILLTASVAIITLLILLQEQFEKNFDDNIEGIDLVLGAQGSPLQLILSSVYQIDAPTGNIDYTEAKKWMRNSAVKTAIPLAFGDNYRGFRIVGTTEAYLSKFKGTLKQGKFFEKDFEVVVGNAVAKKMKLKIGDKFYGSHGDAEEGELHKDHAYIVSGIASPTGKVIDNLILCNIQSVWAMHNHEHAEGEAHEGGEAVEHNHDDHDHEHAGTQGEAHEAVSEEGKEITAVLVKFKGPVAIAMWPRIIAMNTKMQAASPAIEVNRLFSLFGIGLQALQYLAYGIMLISGISIFIALYNTLKERKYEFALLRVNGASRMQLLSLVLIESLLLCVVGFIFGTIVGRLALGLISASSEQEFKMSFDPFEFVWQKEGFLFVLTIFVGILAAVIPALKAYSLNISKTLANA